jgi:hypothetical protein
MIVIPAPACTMVDSDCKMSDALLDALASKSYRGILRYTPLPGNNPMQDISAQELERILVKGFLSGFVQHPRRPGWRPSACDPETDALHSAQFAKEAGYPAGVHGWFDAEGMASDVEDDEAIAYYNAYCHVLVEEGYRAGGYCGYDDAMNATDLYELHECTSYWSDEAKRKVATRGTAIVQGPTFTLLGVPFDSDVVKPDLLGETPFFVQAS